MGAPEFLSKNANKAQAVVGYTAGSTLYPTRGLKPVNPLKNATGAQGTRFFSTSP